MRTSTVAQPCLPPACSEAAKPAVAGASSPASPVSAWGLGLLLLGLAGLVVWLYLSPDGWQSRFFGFNPRAMPGFQQHLHLPTMAPLAPAVWAWGFRALLLMLWGGYALAVIAGLKGYLPNPRVIMGLMGAVSLTLAVFSTPLLTTDCYAYLAYAHMHALHGLNPYVTLPTVLGIWHDPVTHFLSWNLPTVYGPIWTGICDAVVFVCPRSLWGQVVLVKIIAAASLWGTALIGRRLAERFEPGRGTLTFLAIGLNPMLLLEGPGSGHNDLLMMTFALGAAGLFLRKHYMLAGLALGLSAGIKLLTLALLPWMIWECWRMQTGRKRWIGVLGLTAGTLLPLVIGYLPFWQGAATFGALQTRAQMAVDPTSAARNLAFGQWLVRHGTAPAAAGLLMMVRQNAFVLLLFLGLTLRLGRSRTAGRWLTAWIFFAAFVMFYSMGMPDPWYMAWVWPVSLLRWDVIHWRISGACFVVSLALTCLYTCLNPISL